MGLGVSKDNIFNIYEIPLVSGQDEKWLDNSWLVEHLRMLADRLEEKKFRIYSFSIETNCDYKSPTLVIKGFEK